MRFSTGRGFRSFIGTAAFFLVAGLSVIPAGAVDFPESAHPYADNFDFTWVYQSGLAASHLDITFDPQTLVLAGDRIHIMDGSGIDIPGSPFSGGVLGGTTQRVPGANVQIRLVSDGAGTAYGFKVTNIVPLNLTAPDLTISKRHDGVFALGQVGAKYFIEVRNIGTGPTSGPVTVTDQLPGGLAATSIEGQGWNCTQPAGPCVQNEILSPRNAYSVLTLTVNVLGGGGTVVNRATVSGGGDGNLSNNLAEDSTEIESVGPDVRISKAHFGNFIQGQTGATYLIVVSNIGQGPTAGNVVVTDTLPAGLTATGISGSGWNCTQPSGPCSRSDALAPGQLYPAITLTVNVASNAPANVTNTATVTAAGDTDLTNNVANDHTIVQATGPDLRITKTHSGNFTQGQLGATYTVVVTNHGAQPSVGTVTVTETPPAGLTVTGMTGNGWTCTQPAGPCARGDALAVGASYPPITVTVNVSATTAGVVVNAVSVAGGGDLDTSNNTATDPTTVGGDTNCTNVLPESPHPYPNNFDFTWTCVVAGNPSSLNVTFDPLTAVQIGFDFIHVTDANGVHVIGSPFTGTTLAGQTLNIPGNTVKIRLVTDGTLQAYGLKVTNIVGVFPSNADLTISKTHTDTFFRGLAASYSIVVRNVGTGASSGLVTVTDTLPAGLTGASIGGTGWTCTQPAGPCTRSDALAAGASYPAITLTVNVATNAAPNVTNTATVAGGSDTNPNNNSASDPTATSPVNPVCTPGPGLPESGHPYDNNLDQNWTCSLPGNPSSLNVAFDQMTMLEGNDFLYIMDGNGNNIPGSPFTENWLAGLTKSVPGNTVKIRLVSDVRRNEWGFRVTSITGVFSAGPDLTITKTHTGNFVQNQNGATYTIVVRNNGGAASTGLVTVTDNVPAGLTPVSIGGTGWTCTQPAGPCTRNDALASGASYPALTLTVNVAGNAPALVTNTATVAGGGDTVANNNTATDPTTIISPEGCVLPESPHPYENNFDQTWVCTLAGSSLNVTFDAMTRIDTTDLLYVMTGNDVNIPGSPFTGATLAGQTVNVPGPIVKIRLVTDARRTEWGFKVTSVVPVP